MNSLPHQHQMAAMVNPLSPHILVIEDELPQMELLAYNLEKEGFRVTRAMNGEEGLLSAQESFPDLIILDWMLPIVPGIEVCRQLKRGRDTAQIPVMMLTARGEETDRVRGLDTGADDYVVKPYSVGELIARVRAMLRRVRPASVGQFLSHAELSVDTEKHRVSYKNHDVRLGPTEFRLLCTLLENPGRVWGRDQLLDRVWGMEKDIDMRTVDVHVGRLRKALRKEAGSDPIRTVRGFGYALDQ
ncbi:MAG: phosphate regulon transcriptional regulator PhoB [Pseudomonadota bacterium]